MELKLTKNLKLTTSKLKALRITLMKYILFRHSVLFHECLMKEVLHTWLTLQSMYVPALQDRTAENHTCTCVHMNHEYSKSVNSHMVSISAIWIEIARYDTSYKMQTLTL